MGCLLRITPAVERPTSPAFHTGQESLGQEELTARRFVPDPFTGGTMYRSGDLGRLRPGGRLEHFGRIDSQVKICGFRIELDEIRAVRLGDPDVRAAAVVVHRDDPSDAATARIDAYVALSPGGDPATVRERAANVLPEYMLPRGGHRPRPGTR
jgi:acyl-coenzyme A synthetase/AMP-(fatty) acid ligase